MVVDQEGEKNLKEKIAEYSVEAQKNQGPLVELERKATQIALEAIANYH